MNKYILPLCVFFLLIANRGQSQEEDEVLYARAGFKTGVNYSNLTGDISNPEGRVRMHLGAVIEFPIVNRFFAQLELFYSAQGAIVDIATVENKISLNYLSLPIISKYYVTENISLETGPQFSLLSTAKNSATEDADNDFFDQVNSFDFSWGIGASYRLESGLFFQGRYVLGLTNINKESVTPSNDKNSVIQLSVGYLFKTKNNRRRDLE
ncbi:porin family protein [Aquimarina hainanensis]|uniref:Porin family protein n=1 Tax=Aquimarina hainanensis TaxID=1578017 RepID=A0ABW5NEV4_9FLAO